MLSNNSSKKSEVINDFFVPFKRDGTTDMKEKEIKMRPVFNSSRLQYFYTFNNAQVQKQQQGHELHAEAQVLGQV